MIPQTAEITDKFIKSALNYEHWANKERAFAAEFERATKEYIDTGITVFSDTLAGALEHKQEKPRSYIRNLASALKRPFIHAEELSSGLIELQVARSDRLSDLVAGFILVAKELKDPPTWRSPGEDPVYRCDTGGTWRVWFQTDVGKEIFNHFVNRVRTDPIARIILKLA